MRIRLGSIGRFTILKAGITKTSQFEAILQILKPEHNFVRFALWSPFSFDIGKIFGWDQTHRLSDFRLLGQLIRHFLHKNPLSVFEFFSLQRPIQGIKRGLGNIPSNKLVTIIFFFPRNGFKGSSIITAKRIRECTVSRVAVPIESATASLVSGGRIRRAVTIRRIGITVAPYCNLYIL
jgi:hypothetical protein